MAAAQKSQCGWLKEIIRKPSFWLIVVSLLAITFFHYHEALKQPYFLNQLAVSLGLSRHAFERILYLLPMVYAGVFFRTRGWLMISGVALLAMIPRAAFISPQPRDAIFEVVAVFIVNGMLFLLVESLRKEKQHLNQLEITHQELQRKIETITKNERQLAALNSISNIITQSLDLDYILNSALDKVKEVMGVDIALAFLVDEGTDELILRAHRGVSPEFVEGVGKLKIGEGFNGRVAELGEPILIEDSATDSRISREVVKKEGIGAQLAVPLRSKNRVVGTLCAGVRNSRRFLPEDVNLLAAIGNQIGVSIENARLYQRELLFMEQLKASEEQYRGLFENAIDAIFIQDLEGNILEANKACGNLMSRTREELIGANVKMILAEEGFKTAREIKTKLLNGEPINQPYEQPIIKKDGTKGTVKIATSIIMDGGKPIGFQHIARDVTEEKRMQENLRFYVQQVTLAQEEERKRIARELHDDTAQALIALSRQLDNFSYREGELPRGISELLDNLRTRVDTILQGVRRFSRDLRPSVLDDLGLLAALEWLTTDLTRNFNIAAEVQVHGEQHRLPSEVEVVLFRIAQEALRNVWKHAEATRAEVTLDFCPESIRLTVRDNGKGFKQPQMISDLVGSGKLGLVGMQERIRLLGGELKISSELGKGTIISVEIPVQQNV